jgi:four helix bundle protein
MVHNHKDSMIWRKSISLASQVYAMTRSLAASDPHALPAQMCRSAVAVASNIAEGAARSNRTEYIRFLEIARGSLAELQTQICIGLELELIDRGTGIDAQVVELGKLLGHLHRRLREHRERARGFEPVGAPIRDRPDVARG